MADVISNDVREAAGPVVAQSSGGGFARKSSGLVRDFSQIDSWIYNAIAINVVIFGALTFATMIVTYPHASLWLPFIIAGIFCSFEAVAYALFTAAMPRSGGDYVFQSRVLGGGFATFFAFSAITLVQLLAAGIGGFFLANIVLSPFFALLGATYHLHWMTSFSTWLVTKPGVFVCGMTALLIGLAVNVRGLRFYARLQRSVFWIGLVLLVLFLIVMLFTSHAAFVDHFNAYMQKNFGVRHAYQLTIARGGHVSTSFSLKDTILASVIAAFGLIYPAYGVQQAGEIKRSNSVRANIRAMLGAEVFSCLALATIGALLVKVVGHDFLYASGSLSLSGAHNNPLPVPPFLGFLFAVAGNAAIFVWLAFAMFVCWAAMFLPNPWVGASRNIMAMAMDRVLPERLGRVNRRWHVPLNALVVFTLLNIPLLALYAFEPSFQAYTLSFFVVSITAFGATMLAAILFPFVKRDLYQASPVAKYRIGRLPLISVAGAVFLAFVVFVDEQALRANELGINGTKGLSFIGGIYAVALVIYFAAKTYRRRVNKLDLSLVYQELPVE